MDDPCFFSLICTISKLLYSEKCISKVVQFFSCQLKQISNSVLATLNLIFKDKNATPKCPLKYDVKRTKPLSAAHIKQNLSKNCKILVRTKKYPTDCNLWNYILTILCNWKALISALWAFSSLKQRRLGYTNQMKLGSFSFKMVWLMTDHYVP